MYRSNDVCIVGRGCVYSQTWSPEEFVANIFDGKCFVEDLRGRDPETYPFKISEVYNADVKAEDQTYSFYGSSIDRRVLRERLLKSFACADNVTTLEGITLDACSQAVAPIRHLEALSRAEIILGIATVDTESSFYLADDVAKEIVAHATASCLADEALAEVQSVIDELLRHYPIKKPRLAYTVLTTLLERIKEELGIRGPSCVTDAACGSSLAALFLAVKKLRQGEADIVITGGTDLSVGSGCLVYFSRLGAMSPEKTAPFDERAEGLSQGEGAGIFALMRLKDAVANGLHIYGVVRACEGSSDGRSSAIVEPTAEGQRLAYQRAYTDAGVSDVDYVEAHGTGTKVGDRTEIHSLSAQFPGKKIPIGSVKANYGHTIGAAGAAGLLKCIGMIERRAVPPAPYFNRFPKDFSTELFVSKLGQPLAQESRPITMGLSSFGFGGSNYHAVVQEYRAGAPIAEESEPQASRVVICGSEFHALEDLAGLMSESAYRVPPNTLPHVEEIQLLAVCGLEKTFRKLGISAAHLDREKVSVFAASFIPLEKFWSAGRRVAASVFKRYLHPLFDRPISGPRLAQAFEGVMRDKIRITEDTLPGYLSNVIAGRVCNAFDFKGASFNLDSDVASEAAAYRMAKTVLSGSHGMVIVIAAVEELDPQASEITRSGVRITILASAAYALEHDLPIQKLLKEASFVDTRERRERLDDVLAGAHA